MFMRHVARANRDPVRLDAAGMSALENSHYDRFYPYYAELCALSEIRKKPGFGAEFRSGVGGHSLLYLGGVSLDRAGGYPTLKLCDPDASPADHGVGISVNAHYRNANWVAAEGRDFVFRGALGLGEPLTRSSYERTQYRAKAMGVLDGIEFHEDLFRDKPPHMARRDYMYEISIATDYAVSFGRNIYRAKVPLDRPRMARIVDFLNLLNAPFREGKRDYRWSVLNNNCSHVAHNALAQAGIWGPWPTGQFFAIAAFNFPVPKNEFVDLMVQGNDLPIDDSQALYRNPLTRRALLEMDALPTGHGGLATAERAVSENDIYDTEGLRLIFYANRFWSRYHRDFARIFREPRYLDLAANLRHFLTVYREAREKLPVARGDGDKARFIARYERYLAREMTRVETHLANLAHPRNAHVEALV